jgi:acetate kinase
MAILVLNAGSSSLKFALIDLTGQTPRRTGLIERLGTAAAVLRQPGAEPLPVTGGTLRAGLELVHQSLGGEEVTAIGHRVVHGGERFTSATRIDARVAAAIDDCTRLAPLHNPANLAGIASARELFPTLPQVAVFDTAFHQSVPEVAWRYAVPESWYREHGVRRYGFHGTSHRYVALRLQELTGARRIVTAHLGNGCSACAVLDGRSVDTTMGLTPLEGLVMGTRSGDLDPGVLAHIASSAGLDLATTVAVLNRQSGLLGLSGLSNDMRELTAARAAGHPGATLAIAVFCYRLAKTVAALAVPLGGLDALVFTGGIGEHSALVRELTLERLGFLGFQLDPAANAGSGERPVDQTRRAWVIPTDEELMIARETAALLATAG